MTNPSVIDNMDGHQFEHYCAMLLKRNGYHNVRVTPGSGDNGVDILAERDGISYAIQCKCYNQKLGNKAVQEVFSGRSYYNCDEAVVLTNNYFTEPAKDAARRIGVTLWDRNTLLALDRVAYPSNAAFGQAYSSNGKKRIGCAPVLIAVILAIILFSHLGNLFNSNSKEENNGTQSTQYEVDTQISKPEEWIYPLLDDFEYSYQDKGIILGEYKGNATSIVIPESYEVEGHILPVKKLDGTFKNYTSLVNLVIPEGVEHVQYTTFQKTNTLKHIFLPASMTGSETILDDFSDGEILYYGGTEEQWHKLCYLTHWSDVKFKRIVFNASSEDCIANIDTVISELSNANTEPEYVPISDFEFDKCNNELTIIRYLGKDKILKIAPTYFVNGESCTVVAFGNSFIYGKVDTVILPEGVKTLSKAAFNSSGVKRVYLPSSLVNVPNAFWGYFHNVDTIYYGGSEEDFNTLCSIDRWDIDVKHMIYNASPNDIPLE